MRKNFTVISLALILTIVSLSFSYYKWSEFQFPLLPKNEFKSWYVELSAQISPSDRRESIKLAVLKPKDSEDLAVANPQLLVDGYGLEENEDLYELTKRNPRTKESLLLRFSLYELDVNDSNVTVDKEKINKHKFSAENRTKNPDEKTELLYSNLDDLSAAATSKSSDPISLATQVVKYLNNNANAQALFMDELKAKDIADLVQQLLHINNIQARVVNGFELEDLDRSVHISRWLEIADDGEWKSFHIENTDKNDHFYAWWYGNQDLISSNEKAEISTSLAIKSNNDGAFTRSLWLSQKSDSLAYYFALQTLPLEQQLVLQILLLLPIGALIVAFFRQLIGVQTFGTFMPVLIAIALRETGLFYGILFFMGIIIIGLTARSYIEKLQLLMVSRLSSILCIVVLSIVIFMLLNKDSTIPLGISVALFPIIILVMFIERMSTMIEETGTRSAYIGCIGTLALASIIYFVIMNPVVQHIVFTFPEHILVILSGCLLIGRYNGFKLTEYWRFRHLAKKLKESEK